MAKDRPIPNLERLVTFLRTGEGDVPEAVREDAERARVALQAKSPSGLSSLALPVQAAAAEVLAGQRDATTLAALGGATPYKEVRKAAGKALHTLKTKGVHVNESAPRGEAFKYHTVDGEQPRSYASITDPEGDRMVWYGTTVPAHGRMAFQAVIHEVTGIGLFQIFPNMTRKIRAMILDELDEKKIPVYEIDEAYARWLIEEGIRRNRETGSEVPKEYFQAEPALPEAEDMSSDPHPAYGLLMQHGLSGEPTREEVRQGKRLLETPEAENWRALGDFAKLEEEVKNITTGVIITSDEVRREQLDAMFARAAKEHFTAAVRARWQRRLLDLAQHFLVHGHGELARIAVAVGDDLGDEASDVTASPFVLELFHRWHKAKTEPSADESADHDHDHDHDHHHDHDHTHR
jgi:hypothetical protein